MQTTLRKTTTGTGVKGAAAGAESGARGAAPTPLPIWEAKLLFYTLAREKDFDFARENVLLLARLRGVRSEELRKVIDEICEEGLEC